MDWRRALLHCLHLLQGACHNANTQIIRKPKVGNLFIELDSISNPDHTSIQCPGGAKSFFAILALMNKTRLYVFNDGTQEWELVMMEAGDLFVGQGCKSICCDSLFFIADNR